jgi:hypothetical protein
MQRLCQCFVEVSCFFWGGCFLDVRVVLERFAVLYCDFFVKKFIFVKSCRKYVVSLPNKIRYSHLLRSVLCGD